MLGLLGWTVVATITVILLFGIVVVSWSPYDWKLWPAIRRAKREIRNAAQQRVANAEVFVRQGATKISPGHLAFLIKTNTDNERDLLRQDSHFFNDFRDALATARYPLETDPVVHFLIESQETVDREFGGSWYEAYGPR